MKLEQPKPAATISRADLEADRVRQHVARTVLGPLLLSDAQLDASLVRTLAAFPPGDDVWLFGYGSLIWNPMIRYSERVVATLHGYHRGFYLRSRVNRGTPEQPGLVLALDRGGACRGIAYRIARAHARDELSVLWRREMLLGSYRPRRLAVHTAAGPRHAIAFVVDRTSSGYAGKLPDHAIAEILARARGLYGSGADYLRNTTEGLLAGGIRDRRLLRLRKLISG